MATEDVTGLWELAWALNTQFPNLGHDLSRVLAQLALLNLVLDDLVVLVHWDPVGHEEQEIPLQKALHLVADSKSWAPPIDIAVRQLRFHTTPNGDAVYNELPTLAD